MDTLIEKFVKLLVKYPFDRVDSVVLEEKDAEIGFKLAKDEEIIELPLHHRRDDWN